MPFRLPRSAALGRISLLLSLAGFLVLSVAPASAERWSVFRNCNVRPCNIGVALPTWSEPGWSRISTHDGPREAWKRACSLHYNDRGYFSPDIAAGTIDCLKLTRGDLNRGQELVGQWEFGRVNGPVLCQVTLTDQRGQWGYQLRACHPNETFWELRRADLVFIHADGKETTRFWRKSADYWEGPYLSHPSAPARGITHYLRRKPGGNAECDHSGYNPYGCKK